MSGFLNAVGAFVVLLFDAVICFGLVFVIARVMLRHIPGLMARVVIIVVASWIAISIAQSFVDALGAMFR